MRYPVNIQKDGNIFLVSFLDVPKVLTAGDTKEDALEMAVNALIEAFDLYVAEGRLIPMPSKITKKADYISLPLSTFAKILLLNEMLSSGISQSELARRLGTRRQDVQRIVSLTHPTKIDTVEKALQAVGSRFELSSN